MRAGSLLLASCAAVIVMTACSPAAYIDLSPESFSECAGPNIVVRVQWRVRAGAQEPIHVYVSKPGRRESLWVTDGLVGEQTTGAWASDGMSFSLRDGTGKLLVRRTLTSTACPPTP